MLAGAHVEDGSRRAEAPHRPVLARECLELLGPSPGSVAVDLTLGPGGHAEALLEAVGPGGRVLGIDRDAEALAHASERLRRFGDRFVPMRGDHRDLLDLLAAAGVFAVDSILADLGVSSLQLDDPRRGFSFRADGPLDMRMDPSEGPSAADLVATLSEDELREILSTYGEEKLAGPIARAVVRERAKRPLVRTRELRDIVERVAGRRAERSRIHPATRTFQALRIAVNREVEGLERLVSDAVSILRRGGRLAVTDTSERHRVLVMDRAGLVLRTLGGPLGEETAGEEEEIVEIDEPPAVELFLVALEDGPVTLLLFYFDSNQLEHPVDQPSPPALGVREPPARGDRRLRLVLVLDDDVRDLVLDAHNRVQGVHGALHDGIFYADKLGKSCLEHSIFVQGKPQFSAVPQV